MPAFGALIGPGDPAPRVVPGQSPAVLAIHGFGGTPVEVDLVVQVAKECGLAARAPLLAGHGRIASELAKTRFSDWHATAEAALAALLEEHAQVVLVGLSLGSLLATQLCLDHPGQVRGLALLANAFWLREPFPAQALAAYVRFPLPDVHLPKSAADIQDPEARATHLTLSAQPARAASEVWRHGRRLRRRLGEVNCAVYLAHGVLDRVCPFSNLARAAARIGSRELIERACERSGHIVTRDYDAPLVRDDLRGFFGGVRADLLR
ncbi:MAG TPA: alpha/beta fold hydrolase [Polyangiaceae bacterium]|nr:alpha/beta fold hydrolase [Polyangiaceae bacterium]